MVRLREPGKYREPEIVEDELAARRKAKFMLDLSAMRDRLAYEEYRRERFQSAVTIVILCALMGVGILVGAAIGAR